MSLRSRVDALSRSSAELSLAFQVVFAAQYTYEAPSYAVWSYVVLYALQ